LKGRLLTCCVAMVIAPILNEGILVQIPSL
jgi:hypothetical protein